MGWNPALRLNSIEKSETAGDWLISANRPFVYNVCRLIRWYWFLASLK